MALQKTGPTPYSKRDSESCKARRIKNAHNVQCESQLHRSEPIPKLDDEKRPSTKNSGRLQPTLLHLQERLCFSQQLHSTRAVALVNIAFLYLSCTAVLDS